MTLISKSTGALSLASCVYDMHKCGVTEANQGYSKASANSFLSSELNSMRSDTLSYKDSQIKNWSVKNNLFAPVNEFFGMVNGYVKGFLTAGRRYIPNFIAGAVALVSKKEGVANIAAGVLALLEGWNFFKNTSGITQRNDYLEM